MCELNKCLLSHSTEICVVVYYTEMADQYASRVSRLVIHPFSSLNIRQFVFNHQNGGFKRAGLFALFAFCYISNTSKNGLGDCRHSINIWWLKPVWTEFLSLQTQALTNTSHRSNGFDFTTYIYVTKITSVECSLVVFSHVWRIFNINKPLTHQGQKQNYNLAFNLINP